MRGFIPHIFYFCGIMNYFLWYNEYINFYRKDFNIYEYKFK